MMYQSSANASGWFQLNGKSRKMFDIMYTKSVLYKFWIGEGRLLGTATPSLPAWMHPILNRLLVFQCF